MLLFAKVVSADGVAICLLYKLLLLMVLLFAKVASADGVLIC